jgi:hypothetical protein
VSGENVDPEGTHEPQQLGLAANATHRESEV